MASNDDVHPYMKLSQTPLAQQTSMCGVSAKAASVMVGLFALVIISGSHYIIASAMFNMRPTDADFSGYDDIPVLFRTDEEKARAQKKGELTADYNMLTVMGGIAYFSAGITALAELFLLAGAIWTKPQLFCVFFPVMMIAMFLSRLYPFLGSFKIHTDEFKIFRYILVLMTGADVIIVILVVICWGQLAGVHRNRKYQKYAEDSLKPNDEQGQAALLPPGSYPQQV